ncbi:MAG TPA: hypothetical protein ENH13_04005 [Euryarchaeota archaeon]|nr:hypothetical protein [Euryarchaeota archaeon]
MNETKKDVKTGFSGPKPEWYEKIPDSLKLDGKGIYQPLPSGVVVMLGSVREYNGNLQIPDVGVTLPRQQIKEDTNRVWLRVDQLAEIMHTIRERTDVFNALLEAYREKQGAVEKVTF